MGLVQSHTCCPARVAGCFRGRLCPYRKHHGCWFGHEDDLEEVSPCCDVAATSALPLRTGTPAVVGLEAESGVPVKQVSEEIFDCVGQWEKIMDAPVLLRGLDAELGDRFLQVLEQIIEVLKVLPEQIASQLKGWGYEDRISERSGVQTVDLPDPQVMESVPHIVEERVQNRTLEQTTEFLVPQILEAVMEVVPSAPQERVQNRTRKLFVDVPVPHIKEKIAGKVKRTG